MRPGTGATLEALFTKAAGDKVYAGKRGRVARPVVKSLLCKFVQSADDHSTVTAILAALPAAADNLVGFRELTAAVRKVAVRPPARRCSRPPPDTVSDSLGRTTTHRRRRAKAHSRLAARPPGHLAMRPPWAAPASAVKPL